LNKSDDDKMREIRIGTTQYKVYELIKEKETLSIEQIRKLVPANYNTIRGDLIRLTNRGLIARIGKGKYAHKTK
jgi:predicted transcriptional regulator of viral defense system